MLEVSGSGNRARPTIGLQDMIDFMAWLQVTESTSPPAKAVMAIFPAFGYQLDTGEFDLEVMLASDHSIVSSLYTYDGGDVGGFLAPCLRTGMLMPKGQSLRCPGVDASILGLGKHVFRVRFGLSDGSTVEERVTWEVLKTFE